MTTQQVFEKASAALLQAEGALRLPVQEEKLNKAIKKLQSAKSDFSMQSDTTSREITRRMNISIGQIQEVVLEIQQSRRQRADRGYQPPGAMASVALQELPFIRQSLSKWIENQEAVSEHGDL